MQCKHCKKFILDWNYKKIIMKRDNKDREVYSLRCPICDKENYKERYCKINLAEMRDD